MEIESVYNKIVEIINLYRSKEKRLISNDDLDKNLFGDELQGDAYEILGVFTHLEKEFSITITEEKFEKYGFKNIRSIGELIFETIEEKGCYN